MAITTIHPIKTTLELSIDYICDENKTDEQILISTFACGSKTAALKFLNTKNKADSYAKNLARHLIQSFSPEDNLTPEMAHEIGKKLIDTHLKGQFEYVLTTHIDKGHLHNHIIFNNVSFVTGKAYVSNKKTYYNIRKINDKLCKEHNLSIPNDKRKGKSNKYAKGGSYKEYSERKQGNSYKAKLKYAIDLAIRKVKDYEDFLRIMKNNGYEIKFGKHISFRLIGQERFTRAKTRAKTIDEDYTEEMIKERIASASKHKNINKDKSNNRPTIEDKSSNKLAQESEGFARWLKLQNLKNIAKTWNEISSDGTTTLSTFYDKVDEVHDELGNLQREIKSIENEIDTISSTINNINTYKKNKSIYAKYLKANDKDAYFRMHESEIILFESARSALGTPISRKLLSSVSTLTDKLNYLAGNVDKLLIKLNLQKEQVTKVNHLRSNLEIYLSEINIIPLKSIE